MRSISTLSVLVGTAASFKFGIDASIDQSCIENKCSAELASCEADSGQLSGTAPRQSHCRTLMYCIAQVTKARADFPTTQFTDISVCTQGISAEEMSPQESAMHSCMLNNKCMSSPATFAAVESSAQAAATLKAYDNDCMQTSCGSQLSSCGFSPVCKAMAECFELNAATPSSLGQCTSNLHLLESTHQSLLDCSVEKQCALVHRASMSSLRASPSSFFQLSIDRPEEVVNKSASEEPAWKKLRRATDQKLAETHRKLVDTVNIVQHSLDQEKQQLAIIEQEKAKQQDRASKTKSFIKQSLDSIGKVQSFLERGVSAVSPSFIQIDTKAISDKLLSAAAKDKERLLEKEKRITELADKMSKDIMRLKTSPAVTSLVEQDASNYGARAKRNLEKLKKLLADQNAKLKKAGVH